MKVEFELGKEHEAMLHELAQRKGTPPETLLPVLAIFGFRRELESTLERARQKDCATKKTVPTPIDWALPQPPAPIKWPKAVRR